MSAREPQAGNPAQAVWRRDLLVWAALILALLPACVYGRQTVAPTAGPPTPTAGTPSATFRPDPPETSPSPSCNSLQEEAMRPEFAGDVRSTKDLACYDIAVRVDVSKLSLSGRERLFFTNRETTALDALYFRLYPRADVIYGGAMTVTEAKVNGHDAATEVTLEDGTALRIALPDPVAPGGQLTVDLEFEAQVPQDFGGAVKTSEAYGIFNYSAGVMTLANWYPILAVYAAGTWRLEPVSGEGDAVFSESALYHVEVETDPNVTVVSTGRAVARRNTPSGDALHELVSGPARDFILVLSKQIQAARREQNGVRVNSYYLPQDSGPATRGLDYTLNALSAYEKLFGPYPYAELDVVEVPLNRAAGVEYPGLFLVAKYLYEGEETPFFEFVFGHEAAHQWWYGVVGNDVLSSPWLDEALANYSAALYMEQVHGATGLQRTLSSWEETRQQWEAEHADEPVAQPLINFRGREQDYSVVVYVKGALFFQALREEIGDPAFFGALRQYYDDHRYGVARPADLLTAFETASGRDLGALYDQWGVR